MKNLIVLSLILLFAGSVVAQNAPQQAPAAGSKAVAQDKDGKHHHRHRHEHKPGDKK